MTRSTPTIDSRHLYIDGDWSSATSNEAITVTNPFSLEIMGAAPRANGADVDRAVCAARAAFDTGPWGRFTGAERAVYLERIADQIDARGGELAGLVTDEIGQPLGLSTVMNALAPSGTLRFYARVAREMVEEQGRPLTFSAGQTLVRREPVGVAGLIVPWNYPQVLLMSKLAPALAAGCTVVVKPAEETPLDALLLAELVASAGLPPGVVNVVTGGRETGEALVRHPLVDKIAFTGSTEAGRQIAGSCGVLLRPVTLELGGKSAAVVLDDADFDQVMRVVRDRSFMNSGQTCFLLSRVLIPESQKKRFIDGIIDVAQSLRLGDPRDSATDLGPLVSARIRDRVESFIAMGKTEGSLLTGGGRPQGVGNGYFVEPTVFAGCSPNGVIAQEEIFGPVISLFTYRDDAEALALANNSRFGLGGAVLSVDQNRATEFARSMQTGTVGINSYDPDPAAPFGGYKDSGLGRENGPEAVDNYQRVKSIFVPRA
jgi:acyl-CoA reductase-like NAD-dependent aldehyde dehydrogenase